MNTCKIALKEWSATCCALAAGRQIVLLRKGGLLDADGAFELEHQTFWLLPTYEHQHARLVKPEYHDLLADSESQKLEGENSRFAVLRTLARVERVWSFTPEDERVARAPHMWSDEYLRIRWNFRPQLPLLCAALRVWNLAAPQRVAWRENFGGCRSWLELPEALSWQSATPALTDAAFETQMRELSLVFDPV